MGMLNCCNGSWFARVLLREGKRGSFFYWSSGGNSCFFRTLILPAFAVPGDPALLLLYTIIEFEHIDDFFLARSLDFSLNSKVFSMTFFFGRRVPDGWGKRANSFLMMNLSSFCSLGPYLLGSKISMEFLSVEVKSGWLGLSIGIVAES